MLEGHARGRALSNIQTGQTDIRNRKIYRIHWTIVPYQKYAGRISVLGKICFYILQLNIWKKLAAAQHLPLFGKLPKEK